MPRRSKRSRDVGQSVNLYVHKPAVRAILAIAEANDWTVSRAAEWLIIRGMRAEARGQSMRRMRERRAQMGERIPMDESDGGIAETKTPAG